MARYLVVSYDADEDQWFYDTVEAATAEAARGFICLVRSYVIAADASLGADFGVNVAVTINDTEWDANEPLSECQNCGNVYPQSHLQPIKDLGARVEPGEPMPSGECPDCGALCQLREEIR